MLSYPNREAYYHSIIYIALQLSMLDVQAEIQTALDRSDIIVSTARTIYIFECKMTSAQSALKQIEEKHYYAPYLSKNIPILMVGIGFDESKRNIGEWKVKETPGSRLPLIAPFDWAPSYVPAGGIKFLKFIPSTLDFYPFLC